MIPRACEHAVCKASLGVRAAELCKLKFCKEAWIGSEPHSSFKWGKCCIAAAQAAADCLLCKHPLTTFIMMLEEGSRCLHACLLPRSSAGVLRLFGVVAAQGRVRKRSNILMNRKDDAVVQSIGGNVHEGICTHRALSTGLPTRSNLPHRYIDAVGCFTGNCKAWIEVPSYKTGQQSARHMHTPWSWQGVARGLAGAEYNRMDRKCLQGISLSTSCALATENRVPIVPRQPSKGSHGPRHESTPWRT